MANRMNRFTILGSTAITALAIAGGSVVYAAGSSGSTTGTGSTTTVLAQQAPSEKADAFITALAAKLGISEDALRAALKAVALDKVAQLEADGTITAEQAAEARQRIEDGAAPLFGFGRPGGDHDRGGRVDGRGGPGMHAPADIAGFLGITEQQLRTELEGGSTLAEVAANHGKSRDELKAFLTDGQKTKLAEAVTAGRLTQAQADARLAEFTANLDGMIDGARTVGRDGPRFGHGPRGLAPASSAQPSNVN